MDDTNYYENMIACLRAECDSLRQQQADDAELLTAAANTIRWLRAERDALAALLKEIRDALAALLKEIREQGYRKEMTARIDAALAKDKP